MRERKKTTVKCANCDKEFEKPTAEYNRSEKVGRRHVCSRSCAAKLKNAEFPNPRIENLIHNNRRDRYTEFRWFTARARNRRDKKGTTDLTLEYLESLWKRQDGRCPFTGWQLILPISSDGKWPDGKWTHRASLDRIDNDKGYIKGNVRFVSVIANQARGSGTDEDLIDFCEAVADRQSH